MDETAPATPAKPSFADDIREVFTDAIRYWEPRRLAYNGVLAVPVVVKLIIELGTASGRPGHGGALFGSMLLVYLAVIANLLYCAAYIPDVFAQLSGFRAQWRRWRWTLFAGGTAFAALIALTILGAS